MSRFINLGSVRSLQKNNIASGTPLRLDGYIIGTGIAFVNGGADADTITDSNDGLLNAGFAANDVIAITGSTSNNLTVNIASVEAGTITLKENNKLTAEAAGDTVTIASRDGIKIADGIEVQIKAKEANTGDITLGGSSAQALNSGINFFRLTPGSAKGLYVQNLNKVWFDATVTGDGVEVMFEN